MSSKLQKNFFLISFLPALAYWYLEANYPVRVAVTGGLILALIEISVEWVFTRHVHTLSKFNFFLILLLGVLSLMGDEGLWFKLQPCFTGVGIGCFLLYRVRKGRGLLVEMMETIQKPLPPIELVKGMEKHVGFLFFVYGLFMGGVAIWASTDRWLFFKTIGFYLVFAVFMLFESLWMRRRARQHHEQQLRREILRQMK